MLHFRHFFAQALLASMFARWQQGRKNKKKICPTSRKSQRTKKIALGTFSLTKSNACDKTNKPKQGFPPQIHAVLEEQGQHVRHRLHGDVPGRGVAEPSDKQGLDAKKRVQSDTRNFSNFNGKPFIFLFPFKFCVPILFWHATS